MFSEGSRGLEAVEQAESLMALAIVAVNIIRPHTISRVVMSCNG